MGGGGGGKRQVRGTVRRAGHLNAPVGRPGAHRRQQRRQRVERGVHSRPARGGARRLQPLRRAIDSPGVRIRTAPLGRAGRRSTASPRPRGRRLVDLVLGVARVHHDVIEPYSPNVTRDAGGVAVFAAPLGAQLHVRRVKDVLCSVEHLAQVCRPLHGSSAAQPSTARFSHAADLCAPSRSRRSRAVGSGLSGPCRAPQRWR